MTTSTAEHNVAVGIDALDVITSGDFNVAIGSNSLGGLTSGNSNIMIGRESGDTLTTGDNNIIIGARSHVNDPNAVNQIVIGNDTTCVQGNNCVILGNSNTQNIFMGNDGTTAKVHCNSIIIQESGPIASNGAGTKGEIKYHGNHLYICTSSNTWGRIPFETTW